MQCTINNVVRSNQKWQIIYGGSRTGNTGFGERHLGSWKYVHQNRFDNLEWHDDDAYWRNVECEWNRKDKGVGVMGDGMAAGRKVCLEGGSSNVTTKCYDSQFKIQSMTDG